MKYSILGFNQKAVLATTKIVYKTIKGEDKLTPLKLDVTDLLILQHLADFPNRKRIVKTIIDDKMFFWVDYKTLIEELPILDIKKQALSDRLSKLVELDILEKHIISQNGYGNSTFFRMGEKYESLKYSKEDELRYESEKEEYLSTPMVADYEKVSYSTTKGYRSQLQDNNNIINNNTTNNSNKENKDNILSLSKKEEKKLKSEAKNEPTWRDDFNVYLAIVENAKTYLLADSTFKADKEKYYPNIDYALSIEKMVKEYWGTEEGWNKRRKCRSKTLNMVLTLKKGFDFASNRVYKGFQQIKTKQSQPQIYKSQEQDNRKLLQIGVSYSLNGELRLEDGTVFKNNHRYYVARDYKEYSIPVNAPERPDERWEYRQGEGWYLPYDLENADDLQW